MSPQGGPRGRATEPRADGAPARTMASSWLRVLSYTSPPRAPMPNIRIITITKRIMAVLVSLLLKPCPWCGCARARGSSPPIQHQGLAGASAAPSRGRAVSALEPQPQPLCSDAAAPQGLAAPPAGFNMAPLPAAAWVRPVRLPGKVRTRPQALRRSERLFATPSSGVWSAHVFPCVTSSLEEPASRRSAFASYTLTGTTPAIVSVHHVNTQALALASAFSRCPATIP